jgi:hypothetical protein
MNEIRKDEVFVGPIKPTDLKIYYEDGIPYLDYKGIADTNFGRVEVCFPKMGLIINGLECTSEEVYNQKGEAVITMRQYLSRSNEYFTIKTLERNMTKKEIEKELGYKVNIVGDKDV